MVTCPGLTAVLGGHMLVDGRAGRVRVGSKTGFCSWSSWETGQSFGFPTFPAFFRVLTHTHKKPRKEKILDPEHQPAWVFPKSNQRCRESSWDAQLMGSGWVGIGKASFLNLTKITKCLPDIPLERCSSSVVLQMSPSSFHPLDKDYILNGCGS